MDFWNFLSLKIRFTSAEPQRLLNETLRKNIPIWGIEQEKDRVSFHIFPTRKRHFAPFRKTLSRDEAWEEEPFGLLLLFHRFRNRIGFFIGFFLLILSLFFSTRFLWGIEVSGTAEKSYDSICKELAKYGLETGRPLSRLDAGEIALRFDVDHDEYVYVGINVVGTRAKVELRERESVEEVAPNLRGSSNQVARIYGKVVRYEVLSGQIEVKRGDWVKEGDLLIGGIRESKTGSFYPVRAFGRVYAETSRSFSVTVPFEETLQLFEREEKSVKSLEILGFSLDLSPFAPKKKGEGTVLEFAEPVTLFGYALPVVLRERIFLETDSKKEAIKVDRAEKLAYDKYVQFKRDTFAESDEILSENVILSLDERGVTLTAELSLVENICREVPFRFTAVP